MRELIGLCLLGVITVAAALGIYVRRSDSRFRRLLPGVVVTTLGIDLLIVAYLWWFQVGTCTSRDDVVCIINQNQGFLTLLAVLIAGVSVWATLLTNEAARQRTQQRELAQARAAVRDAADEVHHNLIHLAIAFGPGETLRRVPSELSLETLSTLAEPSIRPHVAPPAQAQIDPLRRNIEGIRHLEDAVRGFKPPFAGQKARRLLDGPPGAVQGLANTSVKFLIACWRFHRSECEAVLEQPGLQDLPALAEAAVRSVGVYICFRTSRIVGEGAGLRNQTVPVACWFDDEPLGVPTFAFGDRFRDAAADHSHAHVPPRRLPEAG